MSTSPTKQIPTLQECKERFVSFGVHNPHPFLPWYPRESKKYSAIKHQIARNHKKYGIVITLAYTWELDLERGTKYCKTCNSIKNIRSFRWDGCRYGFNTKCIKCKSLADNKNNEKNTVKSQLLVSPLGIKCNWCNRSDCKLEFNHINGGGYAQSKLLSASNISPNILNGKIDPKTLELLCIDCHHSHTAQLDKGVSPKDIYEKHQIMLQIPDLDQQEEMTSLD